MRLGLGLALTACGGATASVYDPSALTLTGFYEASYGGTPWTGAASAGTSGDGRTLTAGGAGTSPSVGTAVNGRTPAVFDGSDDFLRDGSNTADDYLSASAYTILLLVKSTGAAADTGNIFTNQQLITDNGGYWGIAQYDDGGTQKIYAYHDGGAGPPTTDPMTFAAGTWGMISLTFNGSTLSLDVNESGSPETVPAANLGAFGAQQFRLGVNFSAGKYTTMQVLALITAQSVLSATVRGNIKSRWNSLYGLSL